MKRSGNEGSSCPNTSTAFSTITKCIQELLNMQDGILQMEKSVSQGKSVVKEEQELLRICSSVVACIEMLFGRTEEGSQYTHPTSPSPPSAMEGTSNSYFPTTKVALCAITKCFEELFNMQQLILLSHGESLDTEQQEDVLRIKLSVVRRLKILFKETEEADDEALDVDVDVQGEYYESSDEYEDGVDPAASRSNP